VTNRQVANSVPHGLCVVVTSFASLGPPLHHLRVINLFTPVCFQFSGFGSPKGMAGRGDVSISYHYYTASKSRIALAIASRGPVYQQLPENAEVHGGGGGA
jgi:hypothetical protein